MIEIRYLQAESGANKFGTCNCCGKSSGEDPLMISIKFSYYGHGTLICLCDDCKKKLMEALSPANTSETPNSSDTISRAKAIEICDHAIDLLKGQFGAGALVAIKESIEELPPAQPEITHEQAVGYLQSTGWMQSHDLQMMLDGIHKFTTQPERINGHWIHVGGTRYRCNKCGEIARKGNFCPNCGADMRGEQYG